MRAVDSKRYMFLQFKTNAKTVHIQQERKAGKQHQLSFRLSFE